MARLSEAASLTRGHFTRPLKWPHSLVACRQPAASEEAASCGRKRDCVEDRRRMGLSKSRDAAIARIRF